jgi:hypothetical protein
MYELQEMIKAFTKHAEQADKNQKEWIKSFQDNNPGVPMPDHLTDDFSLPKALASICVEIDKLWREIGDR